MAAPPPIFSEQELGFLHELVRQKVEFLIVGLAAAALQGVPAVTQDIDLWFRDLADPGLKKALDRVGGIYVPPTGFTPPMFAGKSVALFDIVLTMHGLDDFERESADALEVRLGRTRVKVLPLDRIVASKRAANREKDRLILPVLEDAAAVLRGRKRRH